MTQSAIIEIAIGLILMYLVLSLLCTVINEYIATCLKLRAKDLQKSIKELLDHEPLLTNFYDQGLIGGSKEASGGHHSSYFDGKTVAMALIGALNPANPIPGFADVEAAVKALPADSNIRSTLLALLTESDGKLSQLRTSIAGWYDSAMDRLSGVYTRKVKVISLIVGIALAIVLNADSLRVAKVLWDNASLRTQIVEATGSYLKACGDKCAVVQPKSLDDVKKQVTATTDALQLLPIGWPEALPQTGGWAMLWWWIIKICGLLITGIALSLGAPFWFDLLQKFMNLRGAGNKPKSTATP